MPLQDEVESYPVGETDTFSVSLVVRDRSDPDRSSWTVEVTTRNLPGPGGSLAKAVLQMPAQSACDLAPLLERACESLDSLIEGDAGAMPDEPPA